VSEPDLLDGSSRKEGNEHAFDNLASIQEEAESNKDEGRISLLPSSMVSPEKRNSYLNSPEKVGPGQVELEIVSSPSQQKEY